MSQLLNSLHVRDAASLVHPQTNLRKHVEIGPSIVERGEGIYVRDSSGKLFLKARRLCRAASTSSMRVRRILLCSAKHSRCSSASG